MTNHDELKAVIARVRELNETAFGALSQETGPAAINKRMHAAHGMDSLLDKHLTAILDAAEAWLRLPQDKPYVDRGEIEHD